MRKILVCGAVLIASVLGVPSVAAAHHLQQDTSTIDCALLNNVPTVRISADYRDFSPWDMPVFWSAWIDGAKVTQGTLNWPGGDFLHKVSLRTTAGSHDVAYQASWNEGENGGYLSRKVLCPTPTPPPVVICNGSIMPPGQTTCPPPPVIIVCNGVTMSVGTTACPLPPKKPARRCEQRRDVVFHTVPGSGTRLGRVVLYVNHRRVRDKDGHYRLRSMRFGSVLLAHPGRDGRVPIRIVALLRKADGSALQFRVRDRVTPCGKTIRRDP